MRRVGGVLLVFALSAASVAAPGSREKSSDSVLRQYLSNNGFKWKLQKTKNFHLYYEPDSEARRQIDTLKRNVEENRNSVLQLMREERYQPTIHAFLVGSGAQMRDLVGVTVDGRSRPAQHAIFSVVTPDRLDLTHEICHEIASNLWGNAEHWIEEGFATFAQEGSNVYFNSWDLMKSNSLLPLKDLVSPEWTTTMYSPDITYTQLGGFVKFLHDKYGVDRLKQVWQGGSESIAQVYGKPLEELEVEWRAAVVGQFPAPPTRHYRLGPHGYFLD